VDLRRWATPRPVTATVLPIYIEIILLLGFAAAMIAACSYTFNSKE